MDLICLMFYWLPCLWEFHIGEQPCICFTTKLPYGLHSSHLQFYHSGGGGRDMPSSRPVRQAEQVPGQPELHTEV